MHVNKMSTTVDIFNGLGPRRIYSLWDKYKKLSDADLARTSDVLLVKLQNQQGLFTKLHTSEDGTVNTSVVLSHNNLLKSVWWTQKT